MAHKQATPDAVVTIRASGIQRTVAVGPFGPSFGASLDEGVTKRGIKAVWHNETGPSDSAFAEAAPS